LHGDHAEYAIGGHDRNDSRGLGTDQLSGLGPIQEADRRPLLGPSLDEARFPRSDDVAREALAERERAALVLDASVDLADDLPGLARLVVERKQEDGRFHQASGLGVESPEQLTEIARLDGKRS